MEMKADCIIDKKYWLQAIAIDRKIQARNDIFLEGSLDRFIFSFKTNKRIFKGMVFLSVFNREKIGDFIDKSPITSFPDRGRIEALHEESLDRIIDLFQNGEKSAVLKASPAAVGCRGKISRALLSVK
jgi:hypothetical protein